MTPSQKLIQLIVKDAAEAYGKEINLDDWPAVKAFYNEEDCYESRNGVRHSGEETDLECDFSRHYDSEARAVQALDKSWVGYTYYSGGGKHSDADSMPWIEDAYEVKVAREEMVVKRIFEKV